MKQSRWTQTRRLMDWSIQCLAIQMCHQFPSLGHRLSLFVARSATNAFRLAIRSILRETFPAHGPTSYRMGIPEHHLERRCRIPGLRRVPQVTMSSFTRRLPYEKQVQAMQQCPEASQKALWCRVNPKLPQWMKLTERSISSPLASKTRPLLNHSRLLFNDPLFR